MAERVVTIKLQAVATGLVQGFGKAGDAVGELKAKTVDSARSQREEWSKVGTGLTAVGVAITGVGAAALRTGIQYNTLQQTSRAALTSLLGSAQAANAQMDKLDDFARNSPFSKATFITAQQQMLAFGIEAKKVVPYLDAVQNAVAAAGGSNADIEGIVATMSKIQSSAKITAEDLNEFGGRGVNAAELIGSQMGKTGAQIRQDITSGALSAEQALDALAKGMSTTYAGAADNVKDTFAGALDRVSAAWRDFSAELATPLVDPNGGGALVDLLNWAADAMRAFEDLPGPVKTTVSVLTGLVGVGTLLAGAAILAIPKWVAFKDALATFPPVVGNVKGGLQGLWSFLTGPWGIAMVTAATAMHLLNEQVKAGVPSQAELKNALLTTADAAEVFRKAGERSGTEQFFMGDYTKQLEDLSGLFERTGDTANNFFSHAFAGTTNQDIGTLGVLEDMGKALSELSTSDLPAAQEAFRNLAESQSLTKAEMSTMLDRMPEYRDALVEQASAMDMSATDANLLQLAMGELSPTTQSTAEAYSAAADEAGKLTDQLIGLIGAITELNGVGQTAEQTNSTLQDSYASLQEYVANAQAGVEGYSTSLDEWTVAGSANRAMLADYAADVEKNAQAQFELEAKTLGATTAAANFEARLSAGRQQIYDTALALTGNAEQAQLLTDKILAMPNAKEIAVLLERAQEAENELNNLARRRETTIGVRYEGEAGTNTRAYGGTIGFAAGGTVPGLGGGIAGGTVFGRGGTKSDSILVRLSRGEEVIQEPYASMYRRELKQMNRGDFVSGSQGGSNVVIVREVGDVYVQHPLTGKYLLTAMDAIANQAIDTSLEQQAREGRKAGY